MYHLRAIAVHEVRDWIIAWLQEYSHLSAAQIEDWLRERFPDLTIGSSVYKKESSLILKLILGDLTWHQNYNIIDRGSDGIVREQYYLSSKKLLKFYIFELKDTN